MDIHHAAGIGLDADEVEAPDGGEGLGIDRESVNPVVGFGQQAGEYVVDGTVLQAVAGKVGHVEYSFFEDAVAPCDVVEVDGVDGERHKLLLVEHRVVVVAGFFDSDEIVGFAVGGKTTFHKTGGDGADLHADIDISVGPDGFRPASCEQEQGGEQGYDAVLIHISLFPLLLAAAASARNR